MSKIVKGQVGLLFTNKTSKFIMEFFHNVKISQFANPGQTAVATVEL